MGALLGRTTPIQLLIMGLIEIFVFAANEYVQIEIFKVSARVLLRVYCMLYLVMRIVAMYIYETQFDSIYSVSGCLSKSGWQYTASISCFI